MYKSDLQLCIMKKKVVVRYGKDLKLWILDVVLMLVLLIPGTNYWCSFSYVLVITEIFFIWNEFDMYYVGYSFIIPIVDWIYAALFCIEVI